MTATTIAHGLSAQQRRLLAHIYALWLEMLEHPGALHHRDVVWGVRWATSGSRSDAASVSRALRRLEERGLILRQNEHSGNNATVSGRAREAGDPRIKGSRTTNVVLLPAGVELAERLTKPATGDVNRCRQGAA